MATPIRGLRPDTPARRAAGLTLQIRAADLAAALGPAVDPSDPDGIHDLRVATRRLRAAIDAYRALFPKAGLRAFRDEIRDLFRLTGVARDLEVRVGFLAKATADAPPDVAPAISLLRDTVAGRAEQETETVRKAVEAFRAADVVPRLQAFVWGATGVPPV